MKETWSEHFRKERQLRAAQRKLLSPAAVARAAAFFQRQSLSRRTELLRAALMRVAQQRKRRAI